MGYDQGRYPPFPAVIAHHVSLGLHTALSGGNRGPGGAAWPVDEVVIPNQVVYPVLTGRIVPRMELAGIPCPACNNLVDIAIKKWSKSLIIDVI
jgi:hypothetical protein